MKVHFGYQEGNFSNQVTGNMCDTFFGPAKRPEMLEMIRKLNENFTEEEISAYELLGSIHTYYLFAIKQIIKENKKKITDSIMNII